MKDELYMVEDTSDLEWNQSPDWLEFVDKLIPTVRAIASKYTDDRALAQDAVQEAFLTLLYIYPEDIRGYQEYLEKEKTYEEWQATLTSYCLAVAKNRILVTLHSYTTGNMYVGRTQTETKDQGDEVVRIRRRVPARYVSLDQLVEDGAQITADGEISWDVVHLLPDLMGNEESDE